MSVSHERVEVGDTATLIVMKERLAAVLATTIQNKGSASVFLGGEGVTATDYGFELVVGATYAPELKGGEVALYGVVASGTQTLNVLKIAGGE